MKNTYASLDRYDIQLLTILQKNARQTQYDLADAVALSPSSCYRRVQRLRDIGAIQAEVALVDPAALGQMLRLILHISLEKEQLHLKENFLKQICAAEEVLECYNVTGDADFILIVSMKDMQAFREFTEHRLLSNPNLKEFKTMAVINTIKYSTALPTGR